MLISAFEYWLKDFYGLLVTAEPRCELSESQETVTLGEVCGGDASSALTKTAFFGKQLKAAVERFDHTRIKDRLQQMVKRYKLNLEAADIVGWTSWWSCESTSRTVSSIRRQ